MQNLRKLGLVGLVILALCAVVPSATLAVTAYDQATGAALAVGSKIHGTSSNATLTGLFAQTITCKNVSSGPLTSIGTYVEATVTANPDASGNVAARIDWLTFQNCTNSSGTACSMTVNNLPWSPSAGGILAPSTTSASFGMGASGSVTMSGCFFGSTCTLVGAGTGPGGLTHSVTGSWTNSSATVSFSNVALSSACGNNTWTSDFVLKTGTLTPSGGVYVLPDTGDSVGLR